MLGRVTLAMVELKRVTFGAAIEERVGSGLTHTFLKPRTPFTTSNGVCPPLKPRGTLPC